MICNSYTPTNSFFLLFVHIIFLFFSLILFLESLTPSIIESFGIITAPTTTGPASGPLPASSIPAISFTLSEYSFSSSCFNCFNLFFFFFFHVIFSLLLFLRLLMFYRNIHIFLFIGSALPPNLFSYFYSYIITSVIFFVFTISNF